MGLSIKCCAVIKQTTDWKWQCVADWYQLATYQSVCRYIYIYLCVCIYIYICIESCWLNLDSPKCLAVCVYLSLSLSLSLFPWCHTWGRGPTEQPRSTHVLYITVALGDFLVPVFLSPPTSPPLSRAFSFLTLGGAIPTLYCHDTDIKLIQILGIRKTRRHKNCLILLRARESSSLVYENAELGLAVLNVVPKVFPRPLSLKNNLSLVKAYIDIKTSYHKSNSLN